MTLTARELLFAVHFFFTFRRPRKDKLRQIRRHRAIKDPANETLKLIDNLIYQVPFLSFFPPQKIWKNTSISIGILIIETMHFWSLLIEFFL